MGRPKKNSSDSVPVSKRGRPKKSASVVEASALFQNKPLPTTNKVVEQNLAKKAGDAALNTLVANVPFGKSKFLMTAVHEIETAEAQIRAIRKGINMKYAEIKANSIPIKAVRQTVSSRRLDPEVRLSEEEDRIIVSHLLCEPRQLTIFGADDETIKSQKLSVPDMQINVSLPDYEPGDSLAVSDFNTPEMENSSQEVTPESIALSRMSTSSSDAVFLN